MTATPNHPLFMKHVTMAIATVMFFSSCKVLTDSQIKNVNAFATAANKYTDYPSEVFKKRAELRLKNELLQASQFTTPEAIERRVNTGRNFYKSALDLADKFDLSMKLIQQYATLLTKLSTSDYVESLSKSAESLDENLSDLVATYNGKAQTKIPEKAGSEIAKVIIIAGKRLTRSKQAKAIKEFVPQGNELIKVTTANLIEVLDKDAFEKDGVSFPSLKTLLENEKETFVSNYRNIIWANESRINFNSVLTYDAILSDYDHAENLRQTCIEAAKKLAKAHNELTTMVQKKMNMKEIIKTTQDLINDVQHLNKLVKMAMATSRPIAQ